MKIKICGLSRPEDIEAVNLYKPDFIGFVFAESKRKVEIPKAEMLKRLLSKDIKTVGVFVNSSVSEINNICERNIIDLIQLHGDEDEEYIKQLKAQVGLPVIKAVRVKSRDEIISADNNSSCDYLLLDTYAKGTFGGTGKAFDYRMIPKIHKPFFLAGGLDVQNVAEALKTDAFCLDVSSGVEDGRVKSKEKIRNFIERIRNNE